MIKNTIKSFKVALIYLTFALMAVAIIFSAPQALGAEANLKQNIDETGAYLVKKVAAPQLGSTGGEWAVLGLARADYNVPTNYFENYYQAIEKEVKAQKGNLSERRYTEYSRVILALTAIGKDPSNVGGYNLLAKLADYEQVIAQGVNGPSYALLALDSKNYAIPNNTEAKVQGTRDNYVKYLLSKQNADGGWSLGDAPSDPDVTAIVLQSLANYKNDAKVKAAIDKGLDCLSKMQNPQGGFTSFGAINAESSAQAILALNKLDLKLTDSRFVKNNINLTDNLLKYKVANSGFKHNLEDSGVNLMSTEQSFMALISAYREQNNKNNFFDMTDVQGSGQDQDLPQGLDGKHQDVKALPIIKPDITFSDIKNHASKTNIEKLAQRGIINGKTSEKFEPNSNMTRAEFATITTRGLGLKTQNTTKFKDIAADAWYAGFIGSAYNYSIVEGISDNLFAPNNTITREEALTMVARAAKLCGLENKLDQTTSAEVLKDFTDQDQVSDWAKLAVAFCYQEEIWQLNGQELKPKQAIKRSEIADILYLLLQKTELIN